MAAWTGARPAPPARPRARRPRRRGCDRASAFRPPAASDAPPPLPAVAAPCGGARRRAGGALVPCVCRRCRPPRRSAACRAPWCRPRRVPRARPPALCGRLRPAPAPSGSRQDLGVGRRASVPRTQGPPAIRSSPAAAGSLLPIRRTSSVDSGALRAISRPVAGSAHRPGAPTGAGRTGELGLYDSAPQRDVPAPPTRGGRAARGCRGRLGRARPPGTRRHAAGGPRWHAGRLRRGWARVARVRPARRRPRRPVAPPRSLAPPAPPRVPARVARDRHRPHRAARPPASADRVPATRPAHAVAARAPGPGDRINDASPASSGRAAPIPPVAAPAHAPPPPPVAAATPARQRPPPPSPPPSATFRIVLSRLTTRIETQSTASAAQRARSAHRWSRRSGWPPRRDGVRSDRQGCHRRTPVARGAAGASPAGPAIRSPVARFGVSAPPPRAQCENAETCGRDGGSGPESASSRAVPERRSRSSRSAISWLIPARTTIRSTDRSWRLAGKA